jgi:hypothetical protein
MRRTITTGIAMHNYRTRNRAMFRIAIGALVLLLALGGGYYAYWRHVAAQLAAGIEAWVADQRALGNQADFTWAGIGGFPFAFRATFQEPVLHLRQPGLELSWRGSDLIAEMSPWNLREVRIASPSEHSLWLQAAADRRRWRLATAGLDGAIGFLADGRLQQIAMTLAEPDAMSPDGSAATAREARLRLALPEIVPTDYSMPFAALSVEISEAVLPAGRRLLTTDPVALAAIDATIMGPVHLAPAGAVQPPLTSVLAAWRDAGGDIEVERFSFAQGPLSLTGEATLALDGALQPLGAGTVTAGGLGAAVEVLLQDGLIPADRALLARTTAKALERIGADGKPEAKFALSLQNGVVSFGPAPLLQVPPIEWP